MKRILFVCTGNTCRSPMAEALLRRMAAKRGIPVVVRSAGVSTVDGLPVSSNTISALQERQIEHDSSSRAITDESVTWADIILTMTVSHKRELLQWFPEAIDKAFTLKEYTYSDDKVAADIKELESLYTDLHMKQAIGQQLTSEERGRLLELERRIPNFDIVDPFGGPQSVYNKCAEEIEVAVNRLLDKLSNK